MEKRRPTYDLEAFKAVCASPTALPVTRTAILDAAALGFDRAGMADVIQTMRRSHFYKSMTSHSDHAVWQDVYHIPFDGPFGGVVLYVKFTADRITTFRLLSFKEK